MKQLVLSLTFLFGSIVWANSILFEIEGKHGGTVYVLGSIHMGDESVYPLNDEILKAFHDSNYLILEVKLNESTYATMQEKMLYEGTLESNDTLSNRIDEATYIHLHSQLKQLNLPLNSMDRYAPWVVGVLLESMQAMHHGYNPNDGIDRYFHDLATRHKKRIFSMETATLQASYLSNDAPSFQEQFLRMCLDQSSQTKEDFTQMFDAYRTGDLDFFEQNLLPVLQAYPTVNETLIDKRNVYMANKITRYTRNKNGRNYFVVVGLGHLLGEKGIIDILTRQGETIKSYATPPRRKLFDLNQSLFLSLDTNTSIKP